MVCKKSASKKVATPRKEEDVVELNEQNKVVHSDESSTDVDMEFFDGEFPYGELESEFDESSEEEEPLEAFWGLTLEAGKSYCRVVCDPFHISNAAIEFNPKSDGDTPCSVFVGVGEDEEFYLLCTLSKQCPQFNLNTKFSTGEYVRFFVEGGEHTIHLTGNQLLLGLEESQDSGESSEDDLGSYNSETDSDYMENGEEINSDTDEDSEFNGETEEASAKRTKVSVTPSSSAKKQKKSTRVEHTAPSMEEVVKLENEKKTANLKAKQIKQDKENERKKLLQDKQAKLRVEKDKNAAEKAKENKIKKEKEQVSKERKLAGGTVAKDITVGSGKVAKAGKFVSVYYIGRLAKNNKVFDSCLSGKPFKFKLGRSEVIQGWDQGVVGMKIGGKRSLKIPAGQAYGASGIPGTIPKNATLNFEVQLRDVN